MKKTIIKFTKTDSTTVAEGKAKCDKCQKANLDAMFALVRKGEDFDVFEFENGIWNLCEDCVIEHKESGKHNFKG